MPDNTDQALIHALREAGHERAAEHVRDIALAKQLRDAGHTDLAAGLQSRLGGAATAPAVAPAPQQTPEDREAQAFIDDLKAAADSGWTYTRGLI